MTSFPMYRSQLANKKATIRKLDKLLFLLNLNSLKVNLLKTFLANFYNVLQLYNFDPCPNQHELASFQKNKNKLFQFKRFPIQKAFHGLKTLAALSFRIHST